MKKNGIELNGNNLIRLQEFAQELTDAEFTHLMHNTFLNGEYGSDIDVHSSEVNGNRLAKLATFPQLQIMKAYQENGYKPVPASAEPKVNRFEVIDEMGRILYRGGNFNITLSYQDNGETLKVFLSN